MISILRQQKLSLVASSDKKEEEPPAFIPTDPKNTFIHTGVLPEPKEEGISYDEEGNLTLLVTNLSGTEELTLPKEIPEDFVSYIANLQRWVITRRNLHLQVQLKQTREEGILYTTLTLFSLEDAGASVNACITQASKERSKERKD